MAPAGASTRSILARIAVTAPVISSTVSPRTRNAIRKPPIWAGVTSPDSIVSKASSASARVSVEPVATLAMRGLNASMGILFGCRSLTPCIPGGGEIEEILQDQRSVLGQDAFGMKLHAM